MQRFINTRTEVDILGRDRSSEASLQESPTGKLKTPPSSLITFIFTNESNNNSPTHPSRQ
ncbi:hypothetical protein E2C01_029903 [Portunus trituberculatus]|uniref:Uncharacterized protein n=1 Tax=Portunus trituberculatus TaxID=210409 RepID=A0A5B7ESS9_PORTR|nr:hypothetical protein [Portunus trituberculatus]